jgi:copper homeostasis protein
VLVEACVQTIASAEMAERTGADRIELCAALELGGVTPGAGMLRAVRARVGLPLHVLIRPRTGDFAYPDAEIEAMVDEVREARRAGADGIVTGVLEPGGVLNMRATARLVEAAGPLPVTFHRAFDRVLNQYHALEALTGLGVARVLTSGGAGTAIEGVPMLAGLVRAAAGRIVVLAGGGVRAAGVTRLVSETGVTEVHLGPLTGPRGDLDVEELAAVIAALPAASR